VVGNEKEAVLSRVALSKILIWCRSEKCSDQYVREMITNLTMGSMDLAVITNAVVGSFVSANMALDQALARASQGGNVPA
jgi:hypothetical protein